MALGRRKHALRVYSPERAKGKNALREGLRASGEKITRAKGDQPARLIQPWQHRAFGYYDSLGEIKYAAQFYSRALAKLRLYAAEEDDQGEVQETENADAREMLARIQDPGGGRSQLLSSYGRLMFLAGESLLFVTRENLGTAAEPELGDEQWEFLSTEELRVQGGQYSRYRAPSLGVEEYHEPAAEDFEPIADNDAVAYRIWRRHPRFSSLADSTMQGVLDVCEELKLLEMVIRARARSRAAGNGLLLLPDGLTTRPLEPTPDEDPLEDPFLQDLTEAMTAPITDEGSASSVVPLIVRGGTEALAAIKHLALVDPTQLYPETGLRLELIKRLAIGLDMPAEILLGLQDSNHWSAWQVDEQTWKAHLQPIAQYLVDDLTSAFFRPQLRELGLKDWRRFRIAYDAAEIINHPDRTKDAKDLHDRAVLSDEALREASGFDDDDAPSVAEVNRRLGILIRDGSLAVYGEPSVRGGTIEPVAGEVVSVAGEGGSPEAVKSAPPGGAEQAIGDVVGSAAQVSMIMGAADLALRRAREKAGTRLRSLAKRDPEFEKLLTGVSGTQVAFTLGPEAAEKLRAPETCELVAGASELLGESLRQWGIEDESVIAFLGEQIERHAARTLFEERPSPLPPAFANYLAEVQKT